MIGTIFLVILGVLITIASLMVIAGLAVFIDATSEPDDQFDTFPETDKRA